MTHKKPVRTNDLIKDRTDIGVVRTTYDDLMSLRAASSSCLFVEAALVPNGRFSGLGKSSMKRPK